MFPFISFEYAYDCYLFLWQLDVVLDNLSRGLLWTHIHPVSSLSLNSKFAFRKSFTFTFHCCLISMCVIPFMSILNEFHNQSLVETYWCTSCTLKHMDPHHIHGIFSIWTTYFAWGLCDQHLFSGLPTTCSILSYLSDKLCGVQIFSK